ncbi:hypothetical protein CDAR_512311 [Caerostris darwini]|uniref:Uncharacterized protein n=1 Tax=Caerostris darwini TaxID=1538125 RepID=A0AAV4WHN8_9ARAC|nr:hypothetical protein CDAR_512311 [Caerostris darwini]
MATNDDLPNGAEERQGHPSAPKDSAASSLPGSRQTTIAHPGRSRRAATLTPRFIWEIWKKEIVCRSRGGAGELKGKAQQSRLDHTLKCLLLPFPRWCRRRMIGCRDGEYCKDLKVTTRIKRYRFLIN